MKELLKQQFDAIDIQERQFLMQERHFKLEEQQFELIQRRGKMMAQSKMVPETLRNNVADCCIVYEMAQRLNLNAFMVANKIYIVHGKPGFEAKFAIGLLNTSGLIKGELRYESTGKPGTDSEGKRAWGISARTGEKITGPEVTIGMAKKEGWYNKNGSKWPTMPDLMLTYRAASFFINTIFPEILLGMQTVEELHDIKDVQAEVVRKPVSAELYENFDPETGEIKEPEESRQQSLESMDSPSFGVLVQKLGETVNPAGVDALRKLPLFNRCTSAERERFNAMAREKIESFSAHVVAGVEP